MLKQAGKTLKRIGRRVACACVDAASEPAGTQAAPSLARLLTLAAAIEVCLFGLLIFTPLGGTTQSVSPLVRAWPWVLAPAHLFFPQLPLHVSTTPEHNRLPWPAYFFTSLLVTAAGCAAWALVETLRSKGSRRRHLALALVGAAIMGGTLVLLPSMPSDDIFSYIVYGRIAVLHHANPLVAVPAQFPQDPLLSFVYWRDVRSVYGSMWLLASGGITVLAQLLGGALATYVLLFKLLGMACHLANIALIWAILGRLAPRRRLLGTLLYAWNPLCLLEFCASGHNDALMLTFLLAAVYCLVRSWEVPALTLFGLSIATKYVPVALLPLYLFAVARPILARGAQAGGAGAAPVGVAGQETGGPRQWARRLRSAVPYSTAALRDAAVAAGWRLAVVLGVVVVVTLPYWAGPATLEAVLYSPPAERLSNSWQDGISYPLTWLGQWMGIDSDTAGNAVQMLLKAATLVAFAVLWLRQFRRARSLTGTLEAWAWVLLWYVLVAAGWFWPWYVTWVVAVVALLPWSELSVATVLLAAGVLTEYAFRPLGASPIHGYRSVFALGPAVVYLLMCAWWRRHAASRPAQDGTSRKATKGKKTHEGAFQRTSTRKDEQTAAVGSAP